MSNRVLKLSAWPRDFEVQAHWAIAAEYVAKHKVVYKLLDISEVPLQFQNRFPNWTKGIAPCNAEPRMDVNPQQPRKHDLFDHNGYLVERNEVFALPTIEPERFLGSEYRRERIHMPTLEMAITL